MGWGNGRTEMGGDQSWATPTEKYTHMSTNKQTQSQRWATSLKKLWIFYHMAIFKVVFRLSFAQQQLPQNTERTLQSGGWAGKGEKRYRRWEGWRERERQWARTSWSCSWLYTHCVKDETASSKPPNYTTPSPPSTGAAQPSHHCFSLLLKVIMICNIITNW